MQEMGLTDEDFAYIGVKNAAQRKALKMGARGFVEMMLHVDIGGFFNFHSELVGRMSTEARHTLHIFLACFALLCFACLVSAV